MKVAIDRDACTGHGRCYALEDKVFTDDDAGYGEVVDDGILTDPDAIESARRAVETCPERAIEIVEN